MSHPIAGLPPSPEFRSSATRDYGEEIATMILRLVIADWVGDWGPAQERRNPVTVAINWDSTNLSGTVNPGPEAVIITKESFAPDTGW
jgi:hypothetical protein